MPHPTTSLNSDILHLREADDAQFVIDTTSGSLLHQALRFPNSRINTITLYLLALAITWIPLLTGILITPSDLILLSPEHPLRLINDWNLLFMFLFSFPCMLIFCLADQHALSNSLRSVQTDGTVSFSDTASSLLTARWQQRFRSVNISSQFVGVLVGILIAYINYTIYTSETIGYWIAEKGHILPVGIAFLYCIFIFYLIITIYIFRNIAIAFLFKDIVSHANIHLLPMHPDGSGGLHPVGQLGLRNQYVLMLLGINLVLLVAVTMLYLHPPHSLYELIVVAIISYLLLGPLVFAAPLLPFRNGMLRTKTDLMSQVAQRLRVELQRIQGQLPSGPILKEDEELIERLRKIAAVIDELPVWPFDASTLRKFLAAYVIPVLTTVGYPIAKAIFDFTNGHLP